MLIQLVGQRDLDDVTDAVVEVGHHRVQELPVNRDVLLGLRVYQHTFSEDVLLEQLARLRAAKSHKSGIRCWRNRLEAFHTYC